MSENSDIGFSPTTRATPLNILRRMIETFNNHTIEVRESQFKLNSELSKLIATTNSIDSMNDDIIRKIQQVTNRIDLLEERVLLCSQMMDRSNSRCRSILHLATSYNDYQER